MFWRTFGARSIRGVWRFRVWQPHLGWNGHASRTEDDYRLPRREPSGERRAAKAAALAQRWGAHLVGAYVVFNGVMPHPSMAYARSEKAIAGVVAHERRVDDACECTTAEVGEWFRNALRRPWRQRRVPSDRPGQDRRGGDHQLAAFRSDRDRPPEPERPAGRHVGGEGAAGQRRAAADRAQRLAGRDDRREGHDRLERQSRGAPRRVGRHEPAGRPPPRSPR
jgi:hypothetical protein